VHHILIETPQARKAPPSNAFPVISWCALSNIIVPRLTTLGCAKGKSMDLKEQKKIERSSIEINQNDD
jgi:hypothetical protein